MKKSVKTKWVKALRSGKYKQGKRRLKTRRGFCCLGVLCDISKQGEWDENKYYVTKTEQDAGGLPSEVIIWAGLDSYSPTVLTRNKREAYLAKLNDNGKTFAEIADIIEEQL